MYCIDCRRCEPATDPSHQITHKCDKSGLVWHAVSFMGPDTTPDCGRGELREEEKP